MNDEDIQAETAQGANLPVEFKFVNHVVRTVSKDDEIWFVAADVCKVLEHTDTSVAVARLDDDEKGTSNVCTNAGSRKMLTVNESGLYNLIFTSRLPSAKQFRRWVTNEVLPSIRKTGRYEARRQDGPQIDESDVHHAHRRFQQIYTSDFVDPDTLLKLLFGGNIPFSGHNKFRFLAVPACEALGLQNPTAAIRLLPDSEQDSVVIYTPQGPRKMAAITEAGLYFLAFSPRAPGGAGLKQELNFLLLCNAVHFIESAWRECRRRESSRPIPFDTSSGASLEHSIVHASDIARLIQHAGIRPQNRSGRLQEA